ncbi:MAG: uracil-DNA glycosylase [Bryobacteraceae bacterium]
MDKNQIREYLEYYQDLGFQVIYRRATPKERAAAVAPEPQAAPRSSVVSSSSAMPSLPGLAPENDSLAQIRADIGDCQRCRLSKARNKIVFGSGNEASKLVFVGEGPGADEDEQGLPFVGRAGQLLTTMIDNTAAKEGIPIRREDVYICNVVKCRPPENRAPQPDEMEICGQFLYRQLNAIKPKAICALGGTAMKALLNTKEGITKMRGQWHAWNGIPLMITYHPSYLLRQYNQTAKREAWEDLKTLFHLVYD